MNNLSFNKNSFNKSETPVLAKPIVNDPTKLGRRTIEEIKQDMHPSKISNNQTQMKHNNQAPEENTNNQNKLSSLKTFKEWNHKW